MKLGKLHMWWIKEFQNAPNFSMAVDTAGYAGTPSGKALGTLVKFGLLTIDTSFEGGLTILRLSENRRLEEEK